MSAHELIHCKSCDALRQALDDAQIEVLQVSTKVAHDYAEVFAPSNAE